MVRLSVNVNKIALLRNSRGGEGPNVLEHAKAIVEFGADGITVHPRADRRHITPDDAAAIAAHITTVETNFEGDIREEFLDLCLRLRPTQATLVPVSFGELTSHRGWDARHWGFLLQPVIARLKEEGIRVSLFVAGDAEQIPRIAEIGADRIELYTAPYADAFHRGDYAAELDKLVATAEAASRYGLGVNAGHDLKLANLPVLAKAIPQLKEVSIGHYLVAYALEVGMERAVRDYRKAARGERVVPPL